jgi:hypothetical protein
MPEESDSGISPNVSMLLFLPSPTGHMPWKDSTEGIPTPHRKNEKDLLSLPGEGSFVL